jgi:hypothetical protein
VNVPRDELHKLAERFSEEARAEFDASFCRVKAAILNYEPLSLLSYLSSLFLFGRGGLEPGSPAGRFISQFHVELLQALVLQHGQDAFPWLPTAPSFSELLSDLDTAGKTFLLHRMKLKDSESDQTLLQVQEHIRGHTQAVRNWGFPDQIQRTVITLFTPLDQRAEEFIGVKPTALFGMFMKVIKEIERRHTENVKTIAPVLKARTPSDAIRAYGRTRSDSHEITEGLEDVLAGLLPGLGVGQTKALLLQHWSFRLVDTFAFSIDDLLGLYDGKVEPGAFVKAMDLISLPFGSLGTNDSEHFFLDNPVWGKPFMRPDDGRFFVPVPATLLSFGLDILETLVTRDPKLETAYRKRKSEFLETAAADLFRQAFPSAHIFEGSMWPKKGVNENDLLVIVDRVAVVVEAKAGSVRSSRIGGDKSLKSDIKELMVKASEQSHAFVEYLRANPGPHKFETKRGVINEVDLSEVKEFVRLNLTLHQLGNIFSRWTELWKAGLIKPGVDMAPTLTLADLESVFELLDSPCQKLHYLARRADLESHTVYSGGELDLLALYLESGFNIGDLEFESPKLWLDLKFKRLERYFMRGETGEKIRKPRLVLSKWWSAILKHTEATEPLGWTRLGMALLTVPYEDQERIERRFTGTKRIVQRFWKNPGHVDLIYLDTGPAHRRLAVAAFAYRNDLASRREAKIREVIGQVFDGVRADKLLLIGSNVELDKNPWDDLIIAFRPSDASDDA